MKEKFHSEWDEITSFKFNLKKELKKIIYINIKLILLIILSLKEQELVPKYIAAFMTIGVWSKRKKHKKKEFFPNSH